MRGEIPTINKQKCKSKDYQIVKGSQKSSGIIRKSLLESSNSSFEVKNHQHNTQQYINGTVLKIEDDYLPEDPTFSLLRKNCNLTL